MIVNFSKNPFKQIYGVLHWNIKSIFFFVLCSTSAYFICIEYCYTYLMLPVIPVSVLGGALAIFLGFRNSSAYDRWWEARKIWGAITNNSRAFAIELLTYGRATGEEKVEMGAWTEKTIKRQIGWVYALRSSLRKESYCEDLVNWVPIEEQKKLHEITNIPTQMLLIQGREVAYAFEKGWIEEFRFNALIGTVKKLIDEQGKSERIKNTSFPFYYNYFTKFFLWLFTLLLPFTLAGIMENWIMIPISVVISFAFSILSKTGVTTETPFEGAAADTPISTICRNIEIDLLEMIDDPNIPKPLPNSTARFGVIYKS